MSNRTFNHSFPISTVNRSLSTVDLKIKRRIIYLYKLFYMGGLFKFLNGLTVLFYFGRCYLLCLQFTFLPRFLTKIQTFIAAHRSYQSDEIPALALFKT